MSSALLILIGLSLGILTILAVWQRHQNRKKKFLDADKPAPDPAPGSGSLTD